MGCVTDIVETYLSGVTISELARQNNVSRQTIRNKLKKASVWKNKKKTTAFAFITKKQLSKLLDEYSINKIASMYNITHGTVTERANKFNLTHRKKRVSHNKIISPSRNVLEQKYALENKPLIKIAKEYDVSINVVTRWMKDLNIPFREKSETQRIVMRKYNDGFFNKHGYYPQSRKSVLKKMIKTKTERGTLHPPHHRDGYRYEQDTLLDFLNTHGGNFIRNDYSILGTKELDFVDFKKKLAFEYCGTYWHHDGIPRMNKTYHYSKYKECLEKGFKLVTIFSDEWLYNTDIKEKVLNILVGMHEKRMTDGLREYISNNRFESPLILKSLGFQNVREIQPDYTILYKHDMKHRKPKETLSECSGEYFRVWDCGYIEWTRL